PFDTRYPALVGGFGPPAIDPTTVRYRGVSTPDVDGGAPANTTDEAMQMHTSIPANWVGAGDGVPRGCSRHCQPAAKVARTRLQSRPPGWAYVLLIFGALPYIIAVSVTRKTVVAPAWPFCAQCNTLRVRRLIIGLVVLVGGLALPFVGSAVASGVADQP